MSNAVSAERLRSFIKRIEKVEEDRATVAEDLKEIYSEAKSAGFDTTIIRKIVVLRKKELEKRREEQERRQKACIIFSWCIHLEPPMTWWVPQQTEAAAKRRVERAEAFVAPVEAGTATVEEKRADEKEDGRSKKGKPGAKARSSTKGRKRQRVEVEEGEETQISSRPKRRCRRK